MDPLAPVPVVVPLGAAAVLAAGTTLLRRRVADAISVGTAAGTAGLATWLLVRAGPGPIEYWFGGWAPRGGSVLGVALAVDRLGAGLAAFVAVLVTAALVFSWRYFDTVGTLFHVLLLVFLAAATGFALAGDLFTMFVLFEVLSVSAYALTGYRIEHRAPLQAGLNFAVVNSLGALAVLIGIALLYARTGWLNLAKIGQALTGAPADGLVVVALAFLLGGFLVKAAAVPVHFWLGDAYAVAPTPVGVVFAGALTELGIFGATRVYWTVFSGVRGDHDALGTVLLVVGVATAAVAAIMAFEQRHLKRLIAFVTISHSGIMLAGVSTLDAGGLTGASLYAVADGAVKAALFLAIGILLHRLGSVDEDDLRGRGRGMPVVAGVFVLAGLGLAGLPPFGTEVGKLLMDHAASAAGRGWVPPLVAAVSVLTGGAVL
ncbi:MAG TPA: proton-conducting transporter membrane subunit, partial [Actinomycetota bacterium]|nr:proton-conducting transporter membrane subunit [Actinomycetota bacterium]